MVDSFDKIRFLFLYQSSKSLRAISNYIRNQKQQLKTDSWTFKQTVTRRVVTAGARYEAMRLRKGHIKHDFKKKGFVQIL